MSLEGVELKEKKTMHDIWYYNNEDIHFPEIIIQNIHPCKGQAPVDISKYIMNQTNFTSALLT